MDPPALLLHGFGQTRQSWGRTAAELGTQGWQAYAIDQRGHGDSERPVIAAYQYADFSADV
ncbi:MAG TPA: alpha/beta fold hydrolase, partial [Candidatus Binataceae bacterium]